MEFRDVNGQLVLAGENYAVGRGSRIARGTSANYGITRLDENGDWWLDPREGGKSIRLGIPGEQDASGESAKLAFMPLDFEWNAIPSDEVPSRETLSELLDAIEIVRSARFRALEDLQEQLEAFALTEMSSNEIDAIHSFVFDGLGRDQVESILQREPETEPCAA
ncbi:MAG: hypothetical protein SGI77_24970 [Pirellulaceae bacterium]|nr:hypothetical protein [Pirellulaceae bacterium]